jgi:hypothetical protein
VFHTTPNFVPIKTSRQAQKTVAIVAQKTGEVYVLDAAANSQLEVDREGDFYINVEKERKPGRKKRKLKETPKDTTEVVAT